MEPNQNRSESNEEGTANSTEAINDALNQGRKDYFLDIDRMVNEGLGGGIVSVNNGLIEETTTDTMDHPESVQD